MTAPAGHTPDGGVLLGAASAPHSVVVFEDPSCPYCARFEAASGDVLRRAVADGSASVEHRTMAFINDGSVLAANALALAAEAGSFAELHQWLMAHQPDEDGDGWTEDGLVAAGARVGLTGDDYVTGIREGRWVRWVIEAGDRFGEQDPFGTPGVFVDGEHVDPATAIGDQHALAALLH